MAPAAGVGLHLNINKPTRANLAVSYGVGLQGSRGLFFNFGAVFSGTDILGLLVLNR
ncbi:hypothetical protein GCM10023172_01410 [Hymenobacter ginsengisoli]|uniref:DUF5723 domain-containing protein n=1 Tax=Hymenobacter ginsengisoli TaxID=1051626 RepID=A0ABP8PXX0_9BACT